MDELVADMLWSDRQKLREAQMKALRTRPALEGIAFKRLYFKAQGFSPEEIWRKIDMELTITLDCNEDVAMRLASLAELQAERIKANESKGGWRNLAAPQLIDQLRLHVHELESAVNDLTSGKAPNMVGLQAVAKAAADVNNYSFFIADNQDCFVHD